MKFALVILIFGSIALAEPQVLFDKDLSKTDQRVDFAGRGRLTIPIESKSATPQFCRLSIESRDTTRTPVYLSIRTSGTPSTTMWSATLDPNETLAEQTFTFELPPHAQRTNLLLLTAQPGTLELGRVKLLRESREDLIARMKEEHPDGDRARNLLRLSRFPLGIQSGWAIDRDHSDEEMQFSGDDGVIGPSGSPALKMSVNGFMRTEIAPFEVPWPFIQHTGSLYARGKGHVAVVVLADGRGIGQADLDVTGDDWKRMSVTFAPAMLAQTHQFQLITSGTVWIDAMQVAPGGAPIDYEPAMPCEVSLAPSRGDVSAARIEFNDEPATIEYAVTGKTTGAILKSKAINLFGDETALPDVKLSDDFLRRGKLDFTSALAHPMGQFRIEAWVDDASGNRVSTFNELVVTRIRRPRHWNEDAPDSPFGIHMTSITRHLLLAKAIGMNWTRLHDAGCAYTCWAFIEPHKGQWTYSDAAIARYRINHISILGMLGTAPPWATGVPEKPNGPDYWERWNEPRDVQDYANYVKVVTERYKDSIRAWDIWNEPWGKFWSKWDSATAKSSRSPSAVEDFAALQRAGYDAAKKVDPKFTIVGIDTMGGNIGKRWTEPLVKLGALSSCDVYDYHFYNTELTGFPGDAADRTLAEALQSALEKLSGSFDKPIWMSEGNGANRSIVRGFYHHTLPSSVPAEDFLRLCDYQSRYMTRVLSVGVEKIFLYGINVGGEWRAGPGEFQCLVNDDAFAHPQAAAHSALAWELEDTRFVKHLDLKDGIHAYLFEGAGRSVAVITSEAKYGKYVLPHPAGGTVHDLFGNDVADGATFGGMTTYVSASTTPAELERQLTLSRQ